MKKTLVLLLACAVALGCALAGCSGSAGSAGSDPKSAWVGTWDMVEMNIDGNVTNADQLKELRGRGVDSFLVLAEDGTFRIHLGTSSTEGTWEAESATSAKANAGNGDIAMSIEGGTLKMNAAKSVFSFVKGEPRAASATASAASASAASAAAAQQKQTPTLGSTISYDGLDITFGESLGTSTVNNQFAKENGQTVIVVPVSITNTSSKTTGLNMFAVKAYGSQGLELDSVMAYFEDDARMMGDMRPGATLNANLYFPYDGNGDYILTFGAFKTEAEVKIPVAL